MESTTLLPGRVQPPVDDVPVTHDPPRPAEPKTPPRKHKCRLRHLRRRVLYSRRRRYAWPRRFVLVILTLLALSQIVTVTFRWVTPPRSSYMLQDGEPVVYEYVSLDHVSRYVVAATISHEDQVLGPRLGAFDVSAFKDRAVAHVSDADDPSGSTIPQQLVKNIFLWPGQNALRKGIEAVLATQFSLTLSDQRVMELYLNYAQFGPQIYGICAATWYYFDTPPWSVTEHQAGQLMGVLPLPSLVTRAPGGGFDLSANANPKAVDLINGASNVHVPAQIESLGGWEAAVATIGIDDKASDHAPVGAPDSCDVMPKSVAERLERDGFSS